MKTNLELHDEFYEKLTDFELANLKEELQRSNNELASFMSSRCTVRLKAQCKDFKKSLLRFTKGQENLGILLGPQCVSFNRG